MSQEAIKQCYALEDNKAALDCLRREVKQPGPCRSRLVLFTQTGCPGCKEEVGRFKADIAGGLIDEIRIDSPEGAAIAQQNGIDFVPALVVLDCNNNIIEPDV